MNIKKSSVPRGVPTLTYCRINNENGSSRDVYFDGKNSAVVVGGSSITQNSVTRHEVAQILSNPNGVGSISDEDMCECIFGGGGIGMKIQVGTS